MKSTLVEEFWYQPVRLILSTTLQDVSRLINILPYCLKEVGVLYDSFKLFFKFAKTVQDPFTTHLSNSSRPDQRTPRDLIMIP